MSFLDLKTASRRKVHTAFAVPCLLTRGWRGGGGTIALTARFHTRIGIGGDLSGQGYATIIEGIQRVIFNREEFTTAFDGALLTLVRSDIVTFPGYLNGDDMAVTLDARDPYDGPIDEKWSVAPQ